MARERTRGGWTGRAARLATGGVLALGLGGGLAAQTPAGSAPVLHHAHLNSTDPEGAIAWYLGIWPSGSAGMVAGHPAFVAEMSLLFNQVESPPEGAWNPELRRTEPQSAFWHIGGFVDTTDRFEALAARGVRVLRLSVGPDDGRGVTRSGLAPYAGIRTADALPGAGAEPEPPRAGGFGYLVGPDGALVELTGGPDTDPAFAHVHLYHDQPRCAANWYVDVLAFSHAPARDPETGERVQRERWEPCEADRGDRGWPSLERVGTVRAPAATVIHGSGSISIYPRQCTGDDCDTVPPLSTSRGQVLDHVAFGVPELARALERIRRQGVRILDGPYDFDGRPAVLLEGPDGLAIELVEATPPGG